MNMTDDEKKAFAAGARLTRLVILLGLMGPALYVTWGLPEMGIVLVIYYHAVRMRIMKDE